MKKAFIVISIIEPDNNFHLSYKPFRTVFSPREREMQTIMTMTSVDTLTDDDTDIYFLEISDDYAPYASRFHYLKNLKFVPIKTVLPEVHALAKTHPNKSYCEALVLSAFMKMFKQELLEYDYIFKISGRYFLDHTFDLSLCTPYNKDKIFFKEHLSFEWNDRWSYDLVDNRSAQGDNCLRQYVTTIFGWGNENFDKFLDIFYVLAAILNQPHLYHLDIETLIYYFTRPYQDKIIETKWIMYGWQGGDGRFVRY